MKKVFVGLSFFAPMLAMAQQLDGIISLVGDLQSVLDDVAPLIFGLAIVYFFWGVAKYILAAGDAKQAADGKSIMIYGIIAIAVMASVYGLVAFLQTAFDINGGGTISIPALP